MHLNTRLIDFINAKYENSNDSFYLYESEGIRLNCRRFQSIPYENKAIHFASMANANPQFLNIIKEEGISIFVNSPIHLKVALDAGFSNEDIVLTASALSVETMQLIHDRGIQVNLDSPNQFKLWQKLFPNSPVGIRCNIGDKVKPYSNHAGSFIGSESRLGFTLDEIDQIRDKAKINGLHLYVGTDIFDIDYFINCYNQLVEISKSFPNLEYLNFGGGFGISEDGNKQFDFETYGTRVSELMLEASSRHKKNLKLILEPGRIIGGEAGFFVCKVNDIKERPNLLLVGVNASTVQFSRPLLYPDIANHPVTVIRNGVVLNTNETVTTTIYGCSTYSRDLFSKKIKLPKIEIGDMLVFGIAGSYCASSYTTFLGFPKPAEYFM